MEEIKPIIQLSEDPSEEELARDWSLSSEDVAEIRRCKGEQSRRHFALQLCFLRKHGCFLYPFRVPLKILNHIQSQLGMHTLLIPAESDLNSRTTWEHEVKIRDYCGFESFAEAHVNLLQNYLIGLANEGAPRDSLFQKAHEYLFDKRVTPPGPTVLLRQVNSAYSQAERIIFEEVSKRIPDSFRNQIDRILEVDEKTGISSLIRYREYPKNPNPDRILDYLGRYEELRKIGATSLDLSGIKIEVIAQFYSLTCAYSAYRLRRFEEKKRYSLVGCFLSEASRMILDYIIEMNDRYLTDVCRKARNKFEKEHQEFRRKSHQGVDTMIHVMDELVHSQEISALTIGQWRKKPDMPKVLDAVETLRTLKRLSERGYYDQLKHWFPQLRRYFPQFCELPFNAEVGAKTMLSGIKLLRKMNANADLSGMEELIANQFLSESQRKELKDKNGEIPRAYSEIIFALQMRESIRAGQLYLPQSRKNISFWSMIYDPKEWTRDREQHYLDLSLPSSFSEVLSRLTKDHDEAVSGFMKGLPENDFVQVSHGTLKFSRTENGKKEVNAAKTFLESTLPKVRIEDLLYDAHQKTGFLNEFTPLPGYEPRSSEKHEKTLLAALVAHGTNLGIAAMGNSAKGITVDEISNVSRYFVRESTIKAANSVIVNHHHRMRLSKSWGDGSSSSSDGQRFGVQQSSLMSSFYPRYFGHYDRAVTVYTHTSDQYSVFHTDVISCDAREAVYVLDGLLENSTLLRPQAHFTDTHGYTEHIFALCYLLGFSFMPRIKDLAEQRLYKIDPNKNYGLEIEELFSGRIDLNLIEEQWDSIVRIAASLKNKTAPAHLIVGRLSKALPGDRLAKAITQLGRAIKTIFIFRYICDLKMRARIQQQLNRGEARHQLASHIFFANKGQFRDGDYEEMMHKASCLSLLSNAVLLANTAAIDRVMRLRPDAKPILQQADLARISPLLFRRVIPNGTYHFK